MNRLMEIWLCYLEGKRGNERDYFDLMDADHSGPCGEYRDSRTGKIQEEPGFYVGSGADSVVGAFPGDLCPFRASSVCFFLCCNGICNISNPFIVMFHRTAPSVPFSVPKSVFCPGRSGEKEPLVLYVVGDFFPAPDISNGTGRKTGVYGWR